MIIPRRVRDRVRYIYVVSDISPYLVIKVHWFRMSALRSRWEEERKLVREEMQRTVRFFHFKRVQWLSKAGMLDQKGRHGEASYSRK